MKAGIVGMGKDRRADLAWPAAWRSFALAPGHKFLSVPKGAEPQALKRPLFIAACGTSKLAPFPNAQREPTAKEKAAPLLGPLFKEAERREVREDFARYRLAEQGDQSGVVENCELW
jgi:hypothetical protein